MPHPDTYGEEEEEVTMASLAIEFEQRRHQQADGVRDLKALCLRYGGPDGSDWGELLAWIEGELEALSTRRKLDKLFVGDTPELEARSV